MEQLSRGLECEEKRKNHLPLRRYSNGANHEEYDGKVEGRHERVEAVTNQETGRESCHEPETASKKRRENMS